MSTPDQSDDGDFIEYEGPEDKTQRKPRRKAATPRQLVRWDAGKDQLLVLLFQYHCALKNIELPWEEVAKDIAPYASGEAIKQHLVKTRKARIAAGQPVPPKLTKSSRAKKTAASTTGGSGQGDGMQYATPVKNAHLLYMAPAKKTKTPKPPGVGRGHGRKKKGDGEGDNSTMETPVKTTGKRGRKAKAEIEDEDDDDVEEDFESPTKKPKTRGGKRINYKEAFGSDEDTITYKQAAEEMSDEAEFDEDEQSQAIKKYESNSPPMVDPNNYVDPNGYVDPNDYVDPNNYFKLQEPRPSFPGVASSDPALYHHGYQAPAHPRFTPGIDDDVFTAPQESIMPQMGYGGLNGAFNTQANHNSPYGIGHGMVEPYVKTNAANHSFYDRPYTIPQQSNNGGITSGGFTSGDITSGGITSGGITNGGYNMGNTTSENFDTGPFAFGNHGHQPLMHTTSFSTDTSFSSYGTVTPGGPMMQGMGHGNGMMETGGMMGANGLMGVDGLTGANGLVGGEDLVNHNGLMAGEGLVNRNDLMGGGDLVNRNDLMGGGDLVNRNDLIGGEDLVNHNDLMGGDMLADLGGFDGMGLDTSGGDEFDAKDFILVPDSSNSYN